MPVLVVISTLDGGRRNEALRLPAPELASKLGLFRSSAVIVPASTLARTRAPSGTLMRPCARQRSVRRRGSGQRLTIQRTPFSKRCRRLGGRPDQRISTAAAATSPVAASRSSRPLSKSTTTSLAPGARTRQQAADATRPSRCSAARRSYAVHGSPLPCPWRCWFDPSKATPMSDIADSSNMIPTSDYREHAPVAALDRHVACVWTQRIGPGSTPLSPGSLVVGVRFRPGLAPTMLGLPASELIDDRVDLNLLWRRAAGRLAGRLGDAAGPGAAVRLLEGELVERLPGAAPVDPFVEAVVAELRAGPPAPVVAKLAATLGASERQLHRRCLDAFGYGPKTLDRVLRFQRFLSMARSAAPLGHVGLARLAADAGYADQAHLARECRSLGGVPPRRLLG